MRVLFISIIGLLSLGCIRTSSDTTPTHESARTDMNLIFVRTHSTSTESRIPAEATTPPPPQSLPRYIPESYGYGWYGVYGYGPPYAAPPSYYANRP